MDVHIVCTKMCICTGVLFHTFRTIKCIYSSALNPGAVAGIVCAVLLGVFVLGELFCGGTYPVNILASIIATICISAYRKKVYVISCTCPAGLLYVALNLVVYGVLKRRAGQRQEEHGLDGCNAHDPH